MKLRASTKAAHASSMFIVILDLLFRNASNIDCESFVVLLIDLCLCFLQVYDGVECEWPIFLCFLAIESELLV